MSIRKKYTIVDIKVKNTHYMQFDYLSAKLYL